MMTTRQPLAGQPWKRRFFIGNLVVVIVGACVAATDVNATNLHVSQYGRGDFTKIQDALDAAAPGDTLTLLEGTYSNTTERWADGYIRRAVGWIEKPLTIIGTEGAVIDGPEDRFSYAFFSLVMDSLSFEEVRVENMFSALRAEGATRLARCQFVDVVVGVSAGGPEARLWVSSCRFDQISSIGVFCDHGAFLKVTSSEFDCPSDILPGRAFFLAGGAQAIVSGSEFDLIAIAEVQGPATLDIMNCVASIRSIGIITLFPGGIVRAQDVRFEGVWIGQSTPQAVTVEMNASFFGERLAIRNVWNGVLCQDHAFVELRDSHVSNWVHSAVFVRTYRQDDPVYFDMTGNYWGTTDPSAVAEAILDGYDDPEVNAFVEFEPMLETSPIPVKRSSFSEFKSLFSGGN